MLPWMKGKLFGGRQKLIKILNRRFEGETKTDSRKLTDMLVSDSNIFNSEIVKLSVISTEGGVWSVDAASDFTVEKVKTMALGHFYDPLGSAKVSANYKLVLVSGRTLDNDNSVLQEGLKDNDELLLVERRKPPPREHFTEESLRGPTEEEIKAATRKLEPKNTVKIHPPLECSADFQSEIRKILISLVEASARILTATPNAEEVFEQIRERLESKSKPQPDPQAVKELKDMGFPEHVAAKALLLNSSNQRQALDWLLEHGNEIDATPEDEEMNLNGESCVGQAGSSKSSQDDNISDYQKNSKKTAPTMTQTVAKLLDSFRAYKRQEFKPNPKALENLMDMGFAEEEIVDALRITGNNQASACEWLLGERRPSLEDLDNGLDPEGPIYKAIMANPAIQLSLTSPKMLFAFLSMLENPGSANMWINDPDASPVLSQIFKTYHAEKHAQQINRLMEQQQQQHRRT